MAVLRALADLFMAHDLLATKLASAGVIAGDVGRLQQAFLAPLSGKA